MSLVNRVMCRREKCRRMSDAAAIADWCWTAISNASSTLAKLVIGTTHKSILMVNVTVKVFEFGVSLLAIARQPDC